MSRLTGAHIGTADHQVHDFIAIGLLDLPLAGHLAAPQHDNVIGDCKDIVRLCEIRSAETPWAFNAVISPLSCAARARPARWWAHPGGGLIQVVGSSMMSTRAFQ